MERIEEEYQNYVDVRFCESYASSDQFRPLVSLVKTKRGYCVSDPDITATISLRSGWLPAAEAKQVAAALEQAIAEAEAWDMPTKEQGNAQ